MTGTLPEGEQVQEPTVTQTVSVKDSGKDMITIVLEGSAANLMGHRAAKELATKVADFVGLALDDSNKVHFYVEEADAS